MSTKIRPIPEGYHTFSAYLIVRDAADALEFYKKVFGAIEVFRLNAPSGKIAHAEFKIGDSIFMISDENPQCATTAPETLGGSPVKLHLYVPDVDAIFFDAFDAGARVTMPPENQFWGDRMGVMVDPFGHHWQVATHIEDVDPSEYQSRMDAFFSANMA